MKRITALFLTLILIFTLAACGSAASAPGNSEQAQQPTDTAAAESTAPGQEGAASPAQLFLAEFKSRAGDGLSPEEMADALVNSEWVPFGGAVMAVEPGYLNGFSAEIEGFAEGAFFGPMIGSIPFAGYIFRLESGADTAAFVNTLKDKADMRWNICTQADELVCEAEGDTVFFVMSPAAFED